MTCKLRLRSDDIAVLEAKQKQNLESSRYCLSENQNPPSPLESYRGASIATRSRDVLHARSGIPFYLFTINIIYLIQEDASPTGKTWGIASPDPNYTRPVSFAIGGTVGHMS